MALTDIDGQRLGDSVADKLGDRNLIINGAMQVAQRGTGDTGVTGGPSWAADRFRLDISSCGTWTTANTTSSLPSGFSNSIKVDCTSQKPTLTGTNNLFFSQYIEAQNLQDLAYGTSDAKQITLSFWVKSNVTGDFVVELDHGDAGTFNGIKYTINAANTWEYKTLTFDGDTSNVINNDNGVGLYVQWCLAAGPDLQSGTFQSNTWQSTTGNRFVGQTNLAASNTNEWQITGVQLEVGNTATPFQHRSYADELQRCQRYFYRKNAEQPYTRFDIGMAQSNVAAAILVQHPVRMRTLPNVGDSGAGTLQLSDLASGTVTSGALSVTANTNGYDQTSIQVPVASGLTQYRSYMLEGANNSNAYIEFSAEL
jgi:hypothetical protein